MISRDQVLPSLYELQCRGVVGEIYVCARHLGTVATLARDEGLKAAFPGQEFMAYPPLDGGEDFLPEGYVDVFGHLDEGSIVYVAVPDQAHYAVVEAALEAGHHVVCVKPLVLTYGEAEELRELAVCAWALPRRRVP